MEYDERKRKGYEWKEDDDDMRRKRDGKREMEKEREREKEMKKERKKTKKGKEAGFPKQATNDKGWVQTGRQGGYYFGIGTSVTGLFPWLIRMLSFSVVSLFPFLFVLCPTCSFSVLVPNMRHSIPARSVGAGQQTLHIPHIKPI